MIARLLIAGLLGMLVALYEVSVVSFFPSWAGFRPVIPFLILILASSSRSRALAFAIGAAVILDAYTVDYFDLAILRLPLTVLVLGVIADRFFTNRSVYATIALAICGRVLDWVGAWALSFAAVVLDVRSATWVLFPAPAFVVLWDVMSVSLAFLLVASFTGRFLVRPGSSYATR